MTIHTVTTTSPAPVSDPASLGETIEWFDAKGRSETGLPDYLDIDFRVWQDGRSGIYLTPDQREVLAPTGALFWTLKGGRLVFAARYRPAQSSITSRAHGVCRLNDRNLASIQNSELTSLIRGRRVVRMKLADSMYVSIEKLSAVHLEGTLRTRAKTVAAVVRAPYADPAASPVDPAASPVDRLRQLVTAFNTQYGELLPELEEMKPELSVDATAQIRARLEMTL